ncbi:hypothetical protein PF008_g29687 [Phytophthora fragariae]|uniref:Plastocyanin-like domain-containing protein n=1 Tax=Phytophthora fragariae TaxID=53985 RepID=A0A6G0Q7T6_9STRA|nr:hypothetical protein PF008_g29687 [Phytophthora fragariae]
MKLRISCACFAAAASARVHAAFPNVVQCTNVGQLTVELNPHGGHSSVFRVHVHGNFHEVLFDKHCIGTFMQH